LVAGLRVAQRIAAAPVLAPWADAVVPSATATDAELGDFVRGDIGTVFHPVGTMRMGADEDPSAAVGADLKVKGVAGLRVADASVMPRLIRGHTIAPTVFIGYRAADLIAAES
jgi:choline dehydrogenase-like flavoprotein